MSTAIRRCVIAVALAVAANTAAVADEGGDSSDRSKSPHVDEAHAAFLDANAVALWVYGLMLPPDVIVGLPREYGNPFRNDTIA